MRKINTEIVVGLFVIIGVASFTYMAVVLAGGSLFENPGYTLTATFNSTSGLKTGAPVEGAGVQIGTVTAIEFDNELFQSIVHLRLDEGVKVQEDAIAAIRTQGILGEKYVKIVAGGMEEILEDGMEINDTESSISIEELISKYIFEGN
jgi:phospholipid/cholesterol/gamma-HCH transport system substrate-binding protein